MEENMRTTHRAARAHIVSIHRHRVRPLDFGDGMTAAAAKRPFFALTRSLLFFSSLSPERQTRITDLNNRVATAVAVKSSYPVKREHARIQQNILLIPVNTCVVWYFCINILAKYQKTLNNNISKKNA